MVRVVYTRHARTKFRLLAEHGFTVTPEQVEKTILDPDRVIEQPGGHWIAQKGITEQHLLRVIYRHEGDRRVVITFYPGRRHRYEDTL